MGCFTLNLVSKFSYEFTEIQFYEFSSFKPCSNGGTGQILIYLACTGGQWVPLDLTLDSDHLTGFEWILCPRSGRAATGLSGGSTSPAAPTGLPKDMS
jgi:hypothetical protein